MTSSRLYSDYKYLRLVAPLPARRLLSREGLRAQMYAWKLLTVNTPRRFRVVLVVRDT